MLSISSAKTAGGAASYFSDHLTTENAANPHEDYYTTSPGRWIGSGAAALSLHDEVSKDDFARILLALDENHNSLLYKQKPNAQRRAGWDLTFSAPKSVSAIFASADSDLQQQVQQAHDHAVEQAMQYLQENGGIAARRGKGGEILENAKLVAAVFSHATSREQDPQLHSHAFVMNLAQRSDDSWGGIQSREIFKRKMETGAFYRVALAEQLKNLGFKIEQDNRSFKVAQVPEKLVKSWSKRRTQVLDKMNEKGGASAKSAEAAALETRKAKDEIEPEALKKRWQQEAREHDFTVDKINEIRQLEQPAREMPSPENLWQELTQRRSTLNQHQLKAAIFEKAAGVLSTNGAKDYYKQLLKDENTIILTDENNHLRFTSKEMFELEQSIIEQSKQRQSENHQVSNKAMKAARAEASGLSGEQKAMLKHITDNTGIAVVEGMAGTGKSYALKAARAAWEADDKTVIGAALSGKAAAGLEESANIKSQTLHSLLAELEENKKQIDKQTVIVIDEAGMVGSRQLKKLLDQAEQAQAKVVLVGDSKQLQPIDAGGAFRGLSDELGAASLTQIRRQKEDWARQAVTLFSAGEAGLALEMYKERDLLRSAAIRVDTIKTLIDDWQQYISKDRDNIKQALILAATKADVYQLNQAARKAQRDQLGNESITVNNREFRENDRLLFTRNNKNLDVKNGDMATVTAISDNQITVRTDDDRIITIDTESYDHLDYGYAVTTHKAQGATVQKAFVLASEMSGREWSYVAASRAKEETIIYADNETLNDLEITMSRSDQKDFSQDYLSVQPQPEQQRRAAGWER
jgi:Ti-type conjugative transfer relaxase TraA